MSVGQRIRDKRKELDISVEELADMLGKNRATIYRYESDEIENLSLTVIEPLAKALNTSPAFLMGWCDESIKQNLKSDTLNNDNIELNELSSYFSLLNQTGKSEAVKRIKELTLIPTYCNDGGK